VSSAVDMTSSHLGLYLRDGARVECFTYDDQLPILDITSAPVFFTLHVGSKVADETAVRLARELAGKVGVFAAEVERLHKEYKAAEGEAA
jgi:hypothetical protein